MIRTLIMQGNGASKFVRMGYANALQAAGFRVAMWDKSTHATFDVFDEFQPDIFICGTWELDKSIVKALAERPYIKLMLWGNNYGSYDKYIDTKIDTVDMTTDNQKQYIVELKKFLQLDHIFTYYSQRWANVTHDNYLRDFELEPIGLPLAADMVVYQASVPVKNLECDISFIGGYWPYKAENINKYLLPLCYDKPYNVKIFGYGEWPVAQYLGQLDNSYVPSLFNSSKINLNIFEPLSAKYGFDVNERIYKILACGGFCISEYVESAAKDIFTNNEVVFVHNSKELKDAVDLYLSNDDLRWEFIRRGNASIRAKHTYYHRAKNMLEILGINYGVDRLQEIIQELNT
jgi:spore maturation protein CgeB